MVKRHGKYFLMYRPATRRRRTIASQRVSDSPFGPFVEGPGSPILVTDKSNNVISPGHHAVFQRDGRDYISTTGTAFRLTRSSSPGRCCVDPITSPLTGASRRLSLERGPALVQGRVESQAKLAAGAKPPPERGRRFTGAASVLDDNYATRWPPRPTRKARGFSSISACRKSITRHLIRPEYAWKPYRIHRAGIRSMKDWKTLADFTQQPATGSSIEIADPIAALTCASFSPMTSGCRYFALRVDRSLMQHYHAPMKKTPHTSPHSLRRRGFCREWSGRLPLRHVPAASRAQ